MPLCGSKLPVMMIRWYSPATFNPMKRLSWRSVLQRVEGRQIARLWYGLEDGYLRVELDDGSVLAGARSGLGSAIRRYQHSRSILARTAFVFASWS